MAITFTQTIIKPEGTKFFAQVNNENKAKAAVYWAWTESFPGFISQNLVSVDTNTRVHTIVFDTIENYAAYTTAKLTHPEGAERKQYNDANGITFSNQETIS